MQLARPIEVVAHVVGHILGQYRPRDCGCLKVSGILGLQATSEAEAVEGQRRLVGRLKVMKDG